MLASSRQCRALATSSLELPASGSCGGRLERPCRGYGSLEGGSLAETNRVGRELHLSMPPLASITPSNRPVQVVIAPGGVGDRARLSSPYQPRNSATRAPAARHHVKFGWSSPPQGFPATLAKSACCAPPAFLDNGASRHADGPLPGHTQALRDRRYRYVAGHGELSFARSPPERRGGRRPPCMATWTRGARPGCAVAPVSIAPADRRCCPSRGSLLGSVNPLISPMDGHAHEGGLRVPGARRARQPDRLGAQRALAEYG